VKIGDLVELSAYGKKQRYLKSLHGMKGQVIEYISSGQWKIQWSGRNENYWHTVHSRKHLKHTKPAKQICVGDLVKWSSIRGSDFGVVLKVDTASATLLMSKGQLYQVPINDSYQLEIIK